MNKLKLFLENFLIYGLGGIISKLIPLIMVPIVIRLMPNSDYYGLVDMSNTVVSFCSSLAVMGMYDAMYRMFFDKEDMDYKKTVCSTAMLFTFYTSFATFIVMILCKNWIAEFFFDNQKYAYLVYLTAIATLVGATNNIISAPTRMQNKRKIFLVTNTLSPILSYSISIPLLLNGYYIIALPLASCISGLTIEIAFGLMNRSWFSLKLYDRKLLKNMLKLAIPLLPNIMIYWIFNSSDRVMITRILGIGEAGIYSVGSKLGMASQLIYTAFAGGWQYFAFSTMKERDQVESNSKIFEYLGCISFILMLYICVLSQPLYKLLFSEEYHNAYIVAPYLFLAPLLQMLFQVEANQFLVIKKTWPPMLILLFGMFANVFLNIYFIPIIGIEGAAIATLIGYFISDVICTIVLCKMKLMKLSKKFLFAVLIAIVSFCLWRYLLQNYFFAEIILALAVTLSIIFLYYSDLKKVIVSIKNPIK